jgi:hypothetical protein
MENDGVWPVQTLKKATTRVCSVVNKEGQDVGWWANKTATGARKKGRDTGVTEEGERQLKG